MSSPEATSRRGRVLARVALFWIAYFAVTVGTGMVKATVPSGLQDLAWGTASSVLMVVVSLHFLRREGRGPGAVGLRPGGGSVVRFALGTAIGLSLFLLYIGIAMAAGPARVTPAGGAGGSGIELAIATYVALSCMEELGYRGYPLRTLAPAFGVWLAQGIVAAVFALNHVAFGWSWTSVLLGVVTGSLLFGMAALASGGLALPIGLHAAWNTASWAVGEKGTPGLWSIGVAEGERGRAAAAGSASYVAVMLLATAVFWWWYRRSSAGTRRGKRRAT